MMVLVFRITRCLGGNMRLLIQSLIFIFCFFPIMSVQGKTLYVIGHKGSFEAVNDANYFADYYLLKRKISPVGERVIPVNLPLTNPIRSQFSSAIFEHSPVALSEYWDRMSFRGLRPPVVQQSEQAVILFVSRVKGAIGYVSQKPENNPNIDILGEITL